MACGQQVLNTLLREAEAGSPIKAVCAAHNEVLGARVSSRTIAASSNIPEL